MNIHIYLKRKERYIKLKVSKENEKRKLWKQEKLLFAQYGKYYKQSNKEKVLYITNLFS